MAAGPRPLVMTWGPTSDQNLLSRPGASRGAVGGEWRAGLPSHGPFLSPCPWHSGSPGTGGTSRPWSSFFYLPLQTGGWFWGKV